MPHLGAKKEFVDCCIIIVLKKVRKTAAFESKAAVSGGPKGDRTPDLKIANLALSQLSYGPL